jgi:hypothetical protein
MSKSMDVEEEMQLQIRFDSSAELKTTKKRASIPNSFDQQHSGPANSN